MVSLVSECLLVVTLLGQCQALPRETASFPPALPSVQREANADRFIRVHRLRDRVADRVLKRVQRREARLLKR